MDTKATSKPLEPLLPELKGKEAETLYIIGNGFDIYHGLESRYSDFRKWLLKSSNKKLNAFVDDMEKLFPLEKNQDMLWCNFENALGKYREWMISDDYTKEAKTYNDKEFAYQEMVRDITAICGNIRPNMTKWVKYGIKLDGIEKQIELSPDSWYFTFNYTKVLEDVYKIQDRQHVCHIHGSASDGLYVITGHNEERDSETVFDDENDSSHVAMRAIIRVFNQQNKKSEEQIKKHEHFFSNISNVSHVIVIGHSLDDIDRRYFEEIQSRIRTDAEWHFYIRQPKDRFTVDIFTSNLGIGSLTTEHEQKRGRNIELPEPKTAQENPNVHFGKERNETNI